MEAHREHNRRGPNPLGEPGDVANVRIPPDLRARADEYGRSHGLGSFAAVVRYALARLVEAKPDAEGE